MSRIIDVRVSKPDLLHKAGHMWVLTQGSHGRLVSKDQPDQPLIDLAVYHTMDIYAAPALVASGGLKLNADRAIEVFGDVIKYKSQYRR